MVFDSVLYILSPTPVEINSAFHPFWGHENTESVKYWDVINFPPLLKIHVLRPYNQYLVQWRCCDLGHLHTVETRNQKECHY